MSLFLDLGSWVLFGIGSLLLFIGALGVLRLPTLFTRMHAASLTESLGTIAVLTGIMLQAGLTLATMKLLAILLFLLLTSPTSSYALANAALLARNRDQTREQADRK
ncbi:MAG: monovalent cation/H(+) antiporter subunit G [Gammaproteobacteria bacterium]|nr:monovalent cation/H(+) antiporter subunit G [Gammaproteobacteria bacterium]